MTRSRWALLIGSLLITLALASCAAPANDVASSTAGQAPGFWLGLWHGVIAPITLIISWFSETVGIYAVHNRGGWYDFGFLLGLSLVFGGSSGGGRSRGRWPTRRKAGPTTE